MRTIRRIVCHHSASSPTTTPDEIRRWHVDGNGWSDIGYHYVLHIGEDGEWTAAKGRPEARNGSHAQGNNADSIGICVAGDYTDRPLPETAEIALCALVAGKCIEHGIGADAVYGHSEVMRPGYTQCPGYDMDRVRARVADHLAAWRG